MNLSITDGQDVYLSITETPTVVTLSQAVISGALAATVTVGNVVTVNVATMPALSISSVTVSNFPATQVVSVSNLPAATTVTGTVALDTASLAALESITVTVGNISIGSSVSVSNFPATVTVSSLPAISGTVTANLGGLAYQSINDGINSYVGDYGTFPISGTVTAGNLPLISNDGAQSYYSVQVGGVGINGDTWPIRVVNDGDVSISGTVTANLSKPTWTDYSGTIVTAGEAITAISTTTRSYLLAQVTTGQMFLNIGATATTLNSVYFSAGQGFAWETSVPQGIVSIISSVTGTNYVLKEG